MASLYCKCSFVRENIPDEHIGKRAKCPKCKQSVFIKEKKCKISPITKPVPQSIKNMEKQLRKQIKCPSCGIVFVPELTSFENKQEINQEGKQEATSSEIKIGRKNTKVTDSIKTCFIKYVDFNGRASRSEFW